MEKLILPKKRKKRIKTRKFSRKSENGYIRNYK